MNKEVLELMYGKMIREKDDTKPSSLVEQAKRNGIELVEFSIISAVKKYRDELWLSIDSDDLSKKWSVVCPRYSPDCDYIEIDDELRKQAIEYNKQFKNEDELRNNGIFFYYIWKNGKDNYIPVIVNEDEMNRLYGRFKISISPDSDLLVVHYTPIDIEKLLNEAISGKLWHEGTYYNDVIRLFIEIYYSVKNKKTTLKRLKTLLNMNKRIIYRTVYEQLLNGLNNNENVYGGSKHLVFNLAKVKIFNDDEFSKDESEELEEIFKLFENRGINIEFLDVENDEGIYLPVNLKDLEAMFKNDSKYGFVGCSYNEYAFFVNFDLSKFKKRMASLMRARIRDEKRH